MKINVIAILIFATLCADAYPQEQALGRLFTTPAERLAIDRARRKTSAADLVTLNGYVIPKNGKTTAWVNEMPLQADQNNNLLVVQRPGHKPVISMQTESGQRVNVKVGDSVDLQTSAVRTLLEASDISATKKR